MATETQSLSGRRALVTGASSGIGAATAKLLAASGARVAIHYHRGRDAALELMEQIKVSGGEAMTLAADLVSPESRRTLVPLAIAALEGLDLLVNNAGAIIEPQPILELTESAWAQSFALNVDAPFFLAQQAFAHMVTRGGGKIINLSSIGVKYGGSATSLHYSAAKAALETVTHGLAKAGAPHQILVNAIRPGVIATPFHAQVAPEALEKRIQMIPLKRAGTAEEVAQMVLYLASAAGDYITGQIFAISGGD